MKLLAPSLAVMQGLCAVYVGFAHLCVSVALERGVCVCALTSGTAAGVGGTLASPGELCDPRASDLWAVFAGDAVFPTGQFASQQWLQVP